MIRLLVSMTLAIMLVFSVSQPVFAADYAKGTEASPAKAAITKILKMPIGTTTPKAKFTFEFEALTVDDEAATSTNMPKIGDKYAIFDGTETNIGTGGIKEVFKETDNIVEDVDWPHAGVYIYKVTEKRDTWTTPADADYTDEMTFTSMSYNLEVYVDNKADGSGVYVMYIAAVLKTRDDGTAVTTQVKVDPTPGDPEIEGDHSDMIFTNTYLKKTGGTDPKDPKDTVLEISKKVTEKMADQSKYFEFIVTVSSPEIGVATGAAYKAYVIGKEDGVEKVVTSSKNGTIAGNDANGSFIMFTAGTAQTVNLKHGERLVFLELPVGSSFTVTESAVSEYTAGYSLILDGKTPAEQTNQSDNTPLEITKSYIGESKNSAAFSNAFKTVTPTGLSVDDMPFYILIGAAIAILSGYLVFRFRRKETNNAYK